MCLQPPTEQIQAQKDFCSQGGVHTLISTREVLNEMQMGPKKAFNLCDYNSQAKPLDAQL